jgi:hypothetical protein
MKENYESNVRKSKKLASNQKEKEEEKETILDS